MKAVRSIGLETLEELESGVKRGGAKMEIGEYRLGQGAPRMCHTPGAGCWRDITALLRARLTYAAPRVPRLGMTDRRGKHFCWRTGWFGAFVLSERVVLRASLSGRGR